MTKTPTWLIEDAPESDIEAVHAIRDASYAIHINGRRIDPLPGLSEARMLLDALREAGYSVTRDRDAAQRDTEERGESR